MGNIIRGLLALCLVIGSAYRCQASLVISLGGTAKTSVLSPTIADNSIVLTFDQNGPGAVRVTIDANNDAFKVDKILFNVDRAVTFGAALTGGNLVTPSSITYSSNDFGIGGPLTGFDIQVAYSTSGSTGAFFAGKRTQFDVLAAGITEQSFNVTTSNGYLGATHINKPLNGNVSGKYGNVNTVPEPLSWVVWLGLAGLWIGPISRRSLQC